MHFYITLELQEAASEKGKREGQDEGRGKSERQTKTGEASERNKAKIQGPETESRAEEK